MKTTCTNCKDTGWFKLTLGTGQIVDACCECDIGMQLQSDLDKADEKYQTQMMDLTPEEER